jgi:Na+-translocating ferredoxin:NAD+ oxidoreductase RNF subunit RnfB
MQLITIDPEKCNYSHACVRACPVKAITVKSADEVPVVNHDRCIGCGSCLSVCAVNAVSYISSIDHTIEILQSNHKVAAIVDPAISGEFSDITDYRKFVEMIRTLGFDYVNEVSFGVDLVAREYKKLFSNFKGKYYITANCPSVISYIEKFLPEIVTNLSPIVTPMTATAKVVRKKFGADLKVVYIGPCVSAKDEAARHQGDGIVDSVLTFQELRELFKRFDIKESKVEYSDFDPPIGYLGSLYPISSGILEAAGVDSDLLTGQIITTDGKENMIQALDEFSNAPESIQKHFNLFYNEGCIMGPGNTTNENKFLRKTLVLDYSKKRLKDFDKKTWEKEMEFFSGLDLTRSYTRDDQRLEIPSNDRIEEILKSVGKTIDEKSACSACGFRSCRDFAIAVSQGLSDPEACLTYSLKNKQDYIKTLKINNSKLRKQQQEQEENEKILKSDNQKIKIKSETISSLLQKLPSAVVVADENLKVLESNESFVKILGEDAKLINDVIPGLIGADLKTLLPYNIYNLFNYVMQNEENIVGRDVQYNEGLLNISLFSLKQNKIVGAVFRDMYVAEVRQEEIINRVSDVIDENLKMVQNIAFSLGEGASKTERMLNSIIETYKKVKKPE